MFNNNNLYMNFVHGLSQFDIRMSSKCFCLIKNRMIDQLVHY